MSPSMIYLGVFYFIEKVYYSKLDILEIKKCSLKLNCTL